MKNPVQLIKVIAPVRNSRAHSAFLLLLLGFSCGLLPMARAVSPPPDGGYPGNNTAEGDNALFNLDTSQGMHNTANGFQALFSNTTGSRNTAIGVDALYSNTTSYYNTATGYQALYSNTTGGENTANGAFALGLNTTGFDNTADGFQTLLNNTTGFDNTSNGSNALALNTTGFDNTADGFQALLNNTTGFYNTSNGSNALAFNTTGASNTANGYQALYTNTAGNNNTANGVYALFSNTTGNNNTAEGVEALLDNTTGSFNTATGMAALINDTTGNNNTANGGNALLNNSTGSSNIALGFSAGSALTTGSNNIDIGNIGAAAESGKIRIGTKGTHKNAFIAGVSGVTIPGGVGVIVDTNGHLGTIVSSTRFKDDIQPMDKASEAILALQPVTFHYKKELDPAGIRQFGLVAEQVEKVNPDLVARDEQGKPYTVRYEAVNAMLLNEFLKEHRKVAEQSGEIADLKTSVAELKSALQEQAVFIRKVSAQVAADQAALRIVSTTE